MRHWQRCAQRMKPPHLGSKREPVRGRPPAEQWDVFQGEGTAWVKGCRLRKEGELVQRSCRGAGCPSGCGRCEVGNAEDKLGGALDAMPSDWDFLKENCSGTQQEGAGVSSCPWKTSRTLGDIQKFAQCGKCVWVTRSPLRAWKLTIRAQTRPRGSACKSTARAFRDPPSPGTWVSGVKEKSQRSSQVKIRRILQFTSIEGLGHSLNQCCCC